MVALDPTALSHRTLDGHLKNFPHNLQNMPPKWVDAFRKEGARTAYTFRDKKLVPIMYLEKVYERFRKYATGWEILHSKIPFGDGSGWVDPVVDENMTVVGHYGPFESFQIFVPGNVPLTSGKVVEEPVRGVYVPGARVVQVLNKPLQLEDMLEVGAEVIADRYNRDRYLNKGYKQLEMSRPQTNFVLMTDIEGKVLLVASSRSKDGVIPHWATPLDLIAIARLVPILIEGAGMLALGIRTWSRRRAALAAAAKRELTSGATTITRELPRSSDLRFAKGTPLPKPEKPNTVYRIMSNDEAAQTLTNKKLPPPIRGAEGERFVSIDSNYTALFREKELADIERKMGDKVARDAQAERNIRNRMAEFEKSGNADGAAKLKARLEKIEAEHKQRGIANKAEADAVLKEWHAMEGQQVLVEIELEPGTLDEIFRKSVDWTKWGPYSRSEKDVFMWKLERGYGRNIGIPKWQIDAFNKRIAKVRLHAYKQPLGKAGLPKPSGSGPN